MSTTKNTEQATISCEWCTQKLGTGYYFKCKTCSSTYCYIHKDRHECTINNNVKKRQKSSKKLL